MSMYKSIEGQSTQVESINSLSRQDIERYQNDLSSYIAQFQQERNEAEAMFNEVREQLNLYVHKAASQDSRIDALSTLVINLVNRLEKLENGS